jgi:hypothetical protein
MPVTTATTLITTTIKPSLMTTSRYLRL